MWGGAALALAFLVFSPSIWHDWCSVDDAYFVLENPLVQGGLTWAGIRAAWTTVQASYWAPLLWMSFMVDQEISGGAPWSFHLTNVLLFAASVGLLFALVRRWTGRTGVAFATALLWALHPARVESVAWITERKDVLSGLFFLAGLWFYTVGREPEKRNEAGRSVSCLLSPAALIFLSWLCMLFGGMAKQIVIVMPVALTLLDVWPLGRIHWDRAGRDVVRLTTEKWAFWLLAIAYASVPIWTHVGEQAFVDVPLGHRLAMIPVHYLFYFGKLVWPAVLAPLQDDLPLVGWQLGAGLVVLIATTLVAWRFRRKAPWALVGWLWFIGLLFPLSGVVWAGTERVAVRFTYLPQIGLTWAAVLALATWGRVSAGRQTLLRGLLLLVFLFSIGATLRTLSYWRNPDVFGMWIWECHPEQGGACAMGGDALLAQGQWTEALKAYEQGVALGDKTCFIRRGLVWTYLGHADNVAAVWDDFELRYGRSLADFAAWERSQERALLWRVRGHALWARGDYDAARAALGEAVRWEPDGASPVLAEYIRACHESGHPEESATAVERLATATKIRIREWRDLFPVYAQAWKMGARGQAYAFFSEYAERVPDDAANLNYMAWLLATAFPDGLDHARKEEWPAAAVRWAERALESSAEPSAGVWNVLAAARANADDSAGAVRAAEQALELARKQEDKELANALEKRILHYRMGLAWRE